jgi:GntR family transcriptional regulator
MTLNRDSYVTLYIQLAQQLATEIAEGRWAPHARLPSEHDLMKRFDVSRVTVRQAIAKLSEQGLVVRKQGKGTFVAGPVVRHELKDLKGFYDELVSQGLNPETKLLHYGLVETPKEARRALQTTDAKVVFLKRLYSLDGVPIALACTYLPAIAAEVSWDEAVRHPSYAILESLLGIRIAEAQVSIRGRLAGRDLGPMLKLAQSAPLLVVERTSFCDAGTPREYTQFYVNSETYEFTLSASGPLPISPSIKEVARAL